MRKEGKGNSRHVAMHQSMGFGLAELEKPSRHHCVAAYAWHNHRQNCLLWVVCIGLVVYCVIDLIIIGKVSLLARQDVHMHMGY